MVRFAADGNKLALTRNALRAFAHDPRNYADPERFMPERYLTREGKINREILDPRTFTFGYGRR